MRTSTYRLAANLLQSYRRYCTDDTPFAIICDRENAYTEAFDDIVLLDEVHKSYLEKLYLYKNSPYEETIFVDADALFLSDPGILWADFADENDVSCYGHALPLDSKSGWFAYEKTGEFREYIKFGIQMHGGLYYFRKTPSCREVFERAISIAEHYGEYGFAHFDKPADEPVLALSMAVSGMEPCSKQEKITFLISYEGRLRVNRDGVLLMDGKPCGTVVLHFATSNVDRFIYRWLFFRMSHNDEKITGHAYWKLRLSCLPLDIKIPMMRRIKRFVKYSISPDLYRILKKRFKR